MIDLWQDGDFVVGELGQFGSVFEFLYVHHLYGVKLLGFLILALVNIAVLSLTDFLQ